MPGELQDSILGHMLFSVLLTGRQSLRKKCPYSELFLSVYFRMRSEYGEIYLFIYFHFVLS